MGHRLAALTLVLLTILVNSQQSPYASPDTTCPPYFNGSIAGSSCSQQYSICVNGVRQDATCTDGYVFYQTGCVPAGESPECQVDEDEEQEEPDFDCSQQEDGEFSVGCVNQFVKCVAGNAYTMYCPASLVYNGKYKKCLETCDDIEEEEEEEPEEPETTSDAYTQEEDNDEVVSTEAPSSDEYAATSEQPEEQEPVEFDCTGQEDGIYADGCVGHFYMCANNVAFKKLCPVGTVYNPSQKACDYDCQPLTTTSTEAYETSTEADEPSTTTTSTVGYTEEPSTTPQEDVPEPEYSTTTPQDDVTSTTTSGYQTTPGFDDETSTTTTTSTTQAPVRVCHEGQVTTFGTCSSRFTRCQNNAVRSKQCPVNTLFESSLLLCVFELPQCQPVSVPVAYSQPTYLQPDIVLSPFDDNVRLRPRFDDRRTHYQTLVDNPFFVPSSHHHRPNHHSRHEERRHHRGPVIDSPFSTHFRRRAVLNDGFKDFRRVRTDKLQYGNARRVVGTKRFLIDDQFEGPKADFIQSDIENIFPKGRSNRRLGPREDPDGYEDGSGFEPKDLFGATRRKRSAYYGAQPIGGYGQQPSPQISARQAQVNRDCQAYTTATFLTFGDCFDQFIYCSGTGVNRMAACPIGESFDKGLAACSETCGANTVVTGPTGTSTGTQTSSDDVTTSSSVYGNGQTTTTTTTAPGNGYTITATTTVPGNDEPSTIGSIQYVTTTRAPIGDRCSDVSSGLFAIGCSQKYIQCSNGNAVVRICPAALYFDETIASCQFRSQVAACQGQDSSSTYSPPQDQPSTTVEYGPETTTGPAQEQPSTTTSSYGGSTDQPAQEPPTTYSPSVAPYNPIAADDACAGLSDGAHGQGCSSSYIVCSSGRLLRVVNCPLGKGFDPTVEYCRTFSLIPAQACNPTETTTDSGLVQPVPYYTLGDVLTSTVQTSTSTDSGDDVATTTSTGASAEEYVTSTSTSVTVTDSYYERNAVEEAEEQEEETYEETKCTPGTRVSIGFCNRRYQECGATGEYLEKSCRVGKLFDEHLNKCVVKIACGKDAIRQAVQEAIATTSTVSPRKFDQRCAYISGEAPFALGTCNTRYGFCTHGESSIRFCPDNTVFSIAESKCVSRGDECARNPIQKPPVKSYYNNNGNAAEFCDGKYDGLYGNTRDCRAILQCFGGELFEHAACPSNLAFNELTGKCDYPQKVSGCEQHGRTDGVCAEHGAFIADDDNCSVFYRCVWGRKVMMRCPSGTVFNPALSVCDWPNAVPACGAGGSDSNYSTSSYDNNNNNSGY
ncbi:unnamed protein product [Caenorhabditis sp. 36 PRJEB53466]|nr:unnamed protein product [Caenorhabditis sp. 36 PRJEB53466]